MIADIDLKKAKVALARMREREVAKMLEKRCSTVRELRGYEVVGYKYRPCGGEHEPKPKPPAEDEAIRTYVSKIARGCSGFNHPHFHP